jgi:DNA-binding NarL/FixJ family response regulator
MSSPSDRCCAVDAVQHIVPFGFDPEIHMLTKPAKQGKILLADDHPSVVEDPRAVPQPEFEVIATVGNGCSLIAAAEMFTPDVIVTDIAMSVTDGITAAAEILRRNPSARIVFVTVHDESEMVRKALATGAMDYVLKLTAGDDLIPAVHAALLGERHVSPLVGGLRMKSPNDRSNNETGRKTKAAG